MRIGFVDSAHPLLAEQLVAAGHECTALHQVDDAHLVDALAGHQGIVVRSRQLSADLLRQLGDLKFIGRLGSGLENIDRDYCKKAGIAVFNSPEGNRDGVAETAVMLLLMLLKHAVRGNEQAHTGLWLREENRGTDLEGKTVGIIGFGHMGSAFAQRLHGFDVRVMAHDKYLKNYATAGVEECALEQLQEECDAISLHLPLTKETTHFVDAAFIARMRKPFWLINTARGGVVHTASLLDGLDSGKVIGAGLDVLEFERPDLSGLDLGREPHTMKRLLGHEHVVITPHIAGVTHEGKRKMAEVLVRKILAFAAGSAPEAATGRTGP
ncbi:MAG: hypothetical protein IPJ76_10005 [Flavobacteriales bacterium]|nr:MAG: hypothetical protein IPJ76_10005 [Flavobacteriales bacterium]